MRPSEHWHKIEMRLIAKFESLTYHYGGRIVPDADCLHGELGSYKGYYKYASYYGLE